MNPDILRAQKIQRTFYEACEPLDRLEADLVGRLGAPVIIDGKCTMTYPAWVNEIRKQLSELRTHMMETIRSSVQ